MSGYIKAENKQDLKERLDRIEGQARGIKRMVDRFGRCVHLGPERLAHAESLLARACSRAAAGGASL